MKRRRPLRRVTRSRKRYGRKRRYNSYVSAKFITDFSDQLDDGNTTPRLFNFDSSLLLNDTIFKGIKRQFQPYASCFDEYKVTKVVWQFSLRAGQVFKGEEYTYQIPRMVYTYDRDADTRAFSDWNMIHQHQGARVITMRPGRTYSMAFTPTWAISDQSRSTAVNTYTSGWRDLGDVAAGTVDACYNGIQYALDATFAAPSVATNLYSRYVVYMKFRGRRAGQTYKTNLTSGKPHNSAEQENVPLAPPVPKSECKETDILKCE